MAYTTWRKEIEQRMQENNEKTFLHFVCTLTEEELDIEFDPGYGGTEGLPFTAWTEDFVYFPICYDGAEWCGSVSRNPNGEPTRHQGG